MHGRPEKLIAVIPCLLAAHMPSFDQKNLLLPPHADDLIRRYASDNVCQKLGSREATLLKGLGAYTISMQPRKALMALEKAKKKAVKKIAQVKLVHR